MEAALRLAFERGEQAFEASITEREDLDPRSRVSADPVAEWFPFFDADIVDRERFMATA